MERLRKRIYFLAAVLLLVGGFNVYTGTMESESDKDEAWMEQRAPDMVGDMNYLPSRDNSEQSYKMDEKTYELLAPFGIVSRVYSGKAGSFDVVLIASNSRASFHDPRVCFSGQGWTILSEKEAKVDTETRGVVPVTVVEMKSPKTQQIAAYFYRGPSGFNATTLSLKWDMFMQKLYGRSDTDGVFYRFIPQDPACTEDELKAFIAKYMEAAKEASEAYF